MPIYSDEAQGLIHGPFRKHMGRPEDRTPLRSSVGLGSFGDVLRLRETQAIADGREADYSEAESQRRSAEVLRNMAEEGRQEAETARETAEQGRQDAETTRSGSEASRVSSEEARVTAEQARVGAESARVTAEAGRVQAELERETNKITSASVSVDDNVGTPEATVTLGPPSSGGRSINFDFKNLKGDPVNLVPVTNGQIDTIAGDGTVTNDNVLTGTGLTYLWSWIKAKFASLVNGAVQIVQGGTGATTASGARNSLGVPTASSIASTENVTATRNHAVGDYFMLGDVLMKATAAIATGETINASKATPATVQSQIDTLRDSVDRRALVKSLQFGGFSNGTSGYVQLNLDNLRYVGVQLLQEGFKFFSDSKTGSLKHFNTGSYVKTGWKSGVTSSNEWGMQLTDKLTLTPGLYLVFANTPVNSIPMVYRVSLTNATLLSSFDTDYSEKGGSVVGPWLMSVADNVSSGEICLATGTSLACTYSYTERAGIVALMVG